MGVIVKKLSKMQELELRFWSLPMAERCSPETRADAKPGTAATAKSLVKAGLIESSGDRDNPIALTASGWRMLLDIAEGRRTPDAGGGRAAVLTWGYKQQPDLDRLARILRKLSGDSIHLYRVDTGSSEYAIVLATVQMDAMAVQDTFHRWWTDDDAPEIIDLTGQVS